MTYDAIIVGAGPAGSAAAYDLAAQKYSVLLIDKVRFPRTKACAGGLTVKTLKALRFSIEPVIRRICHNLSIGREPGKNKILCGSNPIVFMTERSEFDLFCLNQAIGAGAEFRVVKQLGAISERDRFVEIETELGIFKSKFLIGADGANSTVRKKLHLFPEFRKGFAIEGMAPVTDSSRFEMTFDFGEVPFGYGWVFPKGDHLNIGLYSMDESVHLKAEALYRYCRGKTGRQALKNLSAFAIGFGGWQYRPETQRIFLAGDAAGLADPLLGEGLYNAVKSGQAAAFAVIKAISEGDPAASTYHERIRPIKADIRAAYQLARWFYRFPKLGYAMLSFPPMSRGLMKGYARGLTLNEIRSRFFRLSL